MASLAPSRVLFYSPISQGSSSVSLQVGWRPKELRCRSDQKCWGNPLSTLHGTQLAGVIASGSFSHACHKPHGVGVAAKAKEGEALLSGVKRALSTHLLRIRFPFPIPVLDRYLFKELMTPLLLGLAAFTSLGLSLGTGGEVAAIWQKSGWSSSTSVVESLRAMLTVVVLRVPSYLALSMPIASLLAPLLALGRLGTDTELVALRACGVSTWRMVWPAIVIFSGATGLHLLLAEAVMPSANRAATEAIRIATVSQARRQSSSASRQPKVTPKARRQPVVYPEFLPTASTTASSASTPVLGRLFYAKSFDGDTMHGVTLVDLHPCPVPVHEVTPQSASTIHKHRLTPSSPSSPSSSSPSSSSAPSSSSSSSSSSSPSSSSLPSSMPAIEKEWRAATSGSAHQAYVERVVTAEGAHWDEGRGAWVFEGGTEYVLTTRPHTTQMMQQQRLHATAEAVGATPDDNLASLDATSSLPLHSRNAPVSLRSVRRFSSHVVSGLSRTALELARAEKGGDMIENLGLGEVARLARVLEASRNTRESRRVALRLHQRIALPFACAVFGTLGALLSLRIPRDQKRVGFALTLAIVFAYYALSVAGASMGQLGIMSPSLGAWLPNLAGSMAASLLLILSR